jgi:pimeloyl-ACP methyl ester carboxylesterase
MMASGASSFLDEQRDPHWANIDVTALADMPCPVLLTRGTESPPWFGSIVEALASAIPGAQLLTLEGAGHVPHFSHPVEYVEAVTSFVTARGGVPTAA